MTRLRAAGLAAALAAGPLAWAASTAADPAWVEAHYAADVGPAIQRAIGSVTGRVEVSLTQVLGLPLAVALVVATARGLLRPGRGAWLRRWAPVALAVFSTGYAVFVGIWGLNYRRQPIRERLGYPEALPSIADVRELTDWAVLAMNRARLAVAEDADGVFRLSGTDADCFTAAQAMYRRAGGPRPWLGGDHARAKPILGSRVLSHVGLGGIFIPFTAEPHVNVDTPVSSRPFAVAHELAHQRGVAREDEANFIAFLVALEHGDADFVYSALYEGASYAVRALQRVAPDAAQTLWAMRSSAVDRDVRAEQLWWDARHTPVSAVGDAVNSAYLRANGVQDGVQSYGRVVDLMVAWRRAGGGAPASP